MEKHFAVIGDPIAHSLSPVMHQAGFQAAGINALYQRFRVEPQNLQAAVRGLAALNFTGWNVTIPHKEAIIPYMDELTEEAQLAGAVNTVKVVSGRLIGHNTDGKGFVRSIQSQMGEFADKTAVILGAGGAAKGIALALSQMDMKLIILNRSADKAKLLAEVIQKHGGNAEWGPLEPGIWLNQADLLVQATSVGLKGETYAFSLDGINPQALVVDIIFRPFVTPFLKEAEKRGCQVLNGLPMLLHQGALAWEFWLGQNAPLNDMWSVLVNEIKEDDNNARSRKTVAGKS